MVGQRLGDDTGDRAARGKGGIGHDSHEADRGAAVDEPDSRIRHHRAELSGRRGERRVAPGARAAEDGNVVEGHDERGAEPRARAVTGQATRSVTAIAPPGSGALARPRRTMVSAASLSWMEREKNVATKAKTAAVAKAR
jgi:hypothetical protein